MLMIPLPFLATALLMMLAMIAWRAGAVGRGTFGFVAVIGLYALQSTLMGLRWGYDLTLFAAPIVATAALIPPVVWLAYGQVFRRWRRQDALHLLPTAVIWAILPVARDLVDPALILLYLGYGGALLWRVRHGRDHLALARIDAVAGTFRALVLAAAILIGAGLTDIFIVVDFIRTGGQNVGLLVLLAQIASVLCAGAAAVVASDGISRPETAPRPTPDQTPAPDAAPRPAALPDDDTTAQIEALFTTGLAHRDLELNLRRIARRLNLPDRTVSQAINRAHGISVSQYVNNFRVAEAQHLLTTTDQPVIQIGLAAGFLTKSNFNREFRRVSRVSPSQYRADHAR